MTSIPRVIYQTWETKDVGDVQKYTDTWKECNKGYAYVIFDAEDRKSFILNNFPIRVFNAYCRLNHGVYRADFWRYCILYCNGGVYVDIDTICLGSIDTLLNKHSDASFVCPIDLNNGLYHKHCLFNAFIASVPKNPLFLNCINQIVINIEQNIPPPVFNLDATGPGLIGREMNKILGFPEITSFIGKEGQIGTNLLIFFDETTNNVSDIDGTILFQNKNGNAELKRVYDEECRKKGVDHEWGYFKAYDTD